MLSGVDGTSIAHELPELYRAVLDRVLSLELSGHREEAGLIRREAAAVYSRAWDGVARRRLDGLHIRAERVLGGHERPRPERTIRGAILGIRRPRAA